MANEIGERQSLAMFFYLSNGEFVLQWLTYRFSMLGNRLCQNSRSGNLVVLGGANLHQGLVLNELPRKIWTSIDTRGALAKNIPIRQND